MDNSANPQIEHSEGNRAADETAGAQAQPQLDRSFLSGLRKGTEDARSAAAKAVPKVKSAADGAVYWTAYGVSFAAVFQWELAKGLTPENLKSGVRDGVAGGRKAAEKWINRLRQRKEDAPEAMADPGNPPADAAQPGTA